MQCPQLDTLRQIILPVVRDCQGAITTFLGTVVSKYGTSLAHTTGSRRNLKDIWKMIQWQVFESGTIVDLHDKLRRSKDIIFMVYIRAQGLVSHTSPTYQKAS